MTTLMFAGQGSQYIGMGKDLFPKYKKYLKIADDIVGYSISDLCLKDNNKLDKTNYTQVALYVVEVFMYHEYLNNHPKPDFLLGHSLGEYTALYAAEVFDFATGVKLLQKRGELMNQKSNGAMLAVMGVTVKEIKDLLERYKLNNIYFANYNSPKQTILSGDKDLLEKASEIFSQNMVMSSLLNTSNAFHSPYMQAANEEFYLFLQEFDFNPIKIPVVSNVTADFHNDSNLKLNLKKQLTSPVMWNESVLKVLHLNETDFTEIGPQDTLTNLLKYIKKG